MRSPIYLHHHEVKAYMKSHWTKFYKYIHTKFVNLNPFAKSKVWNHSLFHHILTFWDLNPLGTYHVLRTVQMSKWAYKSDLANVHLMIVTTVRVLVHVIGAWQVLLSATLHYNPNFQVLSKIHKAYFCMMCMQGVVNKLLSTNFLFSVQLIQHDQKKLNCLADWAQKLKKL